MHIERVASVTGMKIDEISIDGTFKGEVGREWSVIGTNLSSPSSGSTCKGRHHTNSETGNFLSTYSSRGSLSENSKSIATMRASTDSEDFDMRVNTANRTPSQPCACSKSAVFRQKPMFSDQVKKKKASCGGLAVGNSLLVIEKDVDDQSAHHGLVVSDFNKANNNFTRWKMRRAKKSLQEAEVFSHKSIEPEMSALSDFYGHTGSQKGPPEKSEKQMASILTKMNTSGVGHALDKNNLGESAKANSNLDDMASAIEAVNCVNQKVWGERSNAVIHELDDGLQSVDTLLNSGKPVKAVSDLNYLASAVEAISHSDEKDCGRKSCAVNYADGSDRLDDKVRVCAICGNVDQTETDVKCNMCSDRATEIFCMHTKLDKVSEGYWIREKCMLMQKSDKERQDESLNKLRHHSKNFGAHNFGNILKSSSTGSGTGSNSCLAVTRSAGTLKVMPANKKKALETSVKLLQVSRLKGTIPCNSKLCESNREIRKLQGATSYDRPESINEENLTQRTCPANNPLTRPLAGSNVHTSKGDKKFEQSVKTEDGDENFDNASKETSYLAKGPRCSNEREKTGNDSRQQAIFSSEVATAIKRNITGFIKKKKSANSREGDLNTAAVSGGRPYLRGVPYLLCAIPIHDFVWKGGFEIWINGRSPRLCAGIQAHFSTLACPKVIEMVTKLPQKILVEIVSRLSTWPAQFPVDHTTEDNIGLYFFAEDFDSYERKYKILLEFLVNNDLALKAEVDGIELLIFTSNLLPDRSQRWNTSLFLWGMFRERGATCSKQPQLLGPRLRVPCSKLNLQTGKGAPESSQEIYKANLEDPEEWCSDDMKVQVEPEHKRVRMCDSGIYECPGSQYFNANEAFQRNETLGTCACSREKQVLASDCKYESGYAIPNLEFSLGSASKSATLGNVSSHNARYSKKGFGFTSATTLKHHGNSAYTSSTEKQMFTVHNKDQSRPVIPNLELSLGPAKDKEGDCMLMKFKRYNDSSPALTLTIAPPIVKNDK